MVDAAETALTNPLPGDRALRDAYDHAVEAENKRLTPEPPYDYAELHIPGLRAVARLARDEQRETVLACASILETIVDSYRLLVLDTPEDQALHNQLTASADRALAAVKESVTF